MLVSDYGYGFFGQDEAFSAEQMRAEFRQTGNHLRGLILAFRDRVWADTRPETADKVALLAPYNEAAIALQKLEQVTELEILAGQVPYSSWFDAVHAICAIIDNASDRLGYGMTVRKNIESWYSSRLFSILSGAYTFTPQALPPLESEFLPLVVADAQATPRLVEAAPPVFAPPVIGVVPSAPTVGPRPDNMLTSIPMPAAEGRLPIPADVVSQPQQPPTQTQQIITDVSEKALPPAPPPNPPIGGGGGITPLLVGAAILAKFLL
jgi:hypothetical protein